MNDWYNVENQQNSGFSKSDWYRPLETNEGNWKNYSRKDASEDVPSENDSSEAEKRKKKFRRIGLTVISLVLAAAITVSYILPPKMVLSPKDHGFGFHFGWSEDDGKDSGFGSYGYDPSEEKPAEELPDDFNDFFEAFFTTEETEETDVRIGTYEDSLSFRLSLTPSDDRELSLKELYSQCIDSIVSIMGYTDESAGYQWGTGVVATSDGIILTNTHVINNCDSAEVVDSNGTTYEAKLVGADAISDLAVLKIEADGLQPAKFGESSVLSVGDNVAAIGNPLGDSFTGTLTNGIISAIERDITYNGRSMTLLQTNTALNEGNSGGALFNMYGQVIGITNMKMMSTFSSIEGIGFAIPSSTVCSVVNSIIEFGEVRGRPSIGITVGQIPTNIAEHYEMPEGLYISAVSEGSDAEKQGIIPGDVLTAVDGTPVTDVNQVNDIKNSKQVGEKMVFSIWRDGKELEIPVSLVDTNDIYK